MSNAEFWFKVFPNEDLVSREKRWDKKIKKLHKKGLTTAGVGPDGDYPVRYAFDGDGTMTFDEWWKGDPSTPWYEVYNTVSLEQVWDDSTVSFADDPDFDEALNLAVAAYV